MIPVNCKRLIEVDFPIAKVSEHSAKEKSIRHGHPSTLHLWWARRPLAACRAVLLGLLLPAPTDRECPDSFKSKARELLAKRYSGLSGTGVPPVGLHGQDAHATSKDQQLQDLLLKFIGEFADWNNAANALYLEIGRGLVKAAHPEETPVVVDPFSGGGSIPLEALRLGCEAFASDLNPVACLILKTLLEDIPRYGNAEFKLPGKDGTEVVVHGLADALRHVGRQVKETAEKELAHAYPPDPDGSRPIAYLWARTVRCEGIGCGAEIPLVRSFWLCNKSGRKRALRYRVERAKEETPKAVFEVFSPKNENEVSAGSVSRANATCLCCNTVLPAERVRAQLSAQQGGADAQLDAKGSRTGGATLLAVATLHKDLTGRNYRVATSADYLAVRSAQQKANNLPSGAVPDEPSPIGGGKGAGRAFSVRKYGMNTFGQLFTARQKLALATLARLMNQNSVNGSLRCLLALSLSRCCEQSSSLVRWRTTVEAVAGTFGRQALPIMWDFVEIVPTGDGGSNFSAAIEWVAEVAEIQSQTIRHSGSLQQADACESPLPDHSASVWFTDPPYYDAVPYSDLSDYFVVWLKRVLPQETLLRDPFDPTNLLSPKIREAVQDETKFVNGSPKDGRFFELTMARAFAEGQRVLRAEGVGCVVFAHKTTEGWEALLAGVIRGGWVITASWPIATERPGRLRSQDSAALSTSVHLVCRPRPADTGVGDWSDVKAAMEERIREWLPTLVKHGVRGADAIFSCLGPALESYSRYDKVLTAADREVPLGGDPDSTEPQERGFLAYVFEALSKEALRQVLGGEESGTGVSPVDATNPGVPPVGPHGQDAHATMDTEGFEEDARLTALFLWTLQATKSNGSAKADAADEDQEESGDEEDEAKPKKAKPGFTMPFDTFIRITRPMGIHYPALEGRVLEIEKGVVRLLSTKERTEELLGDLPAAMQAGAAERPGIEISLEDFRQLELGLVEKQRTEAALPTKPKKGKKAVPGRPLGEATFTTLDRIHRAMLLFGLGRSTLLRQVLETEMRQGKRFERLALALNALYPEGSDERRMLEGVQAAMRGVK